MNFKDIHIGELINTKVAEKKIEQTRICKFLSINKAELDLMYQQKSIDTENLLRWSKLLEYDFFRLYTQHLILYAPASKEKDGNKTKVTKLPEFRKNIYTQEIIDYILELIETKKKTIQEIIEEYKIPKTTLYKWVSKFQKK